MRLIPLAMIRNRNIDFNQLQTLFELFELNLMEIHKLPEVSDEDLIAIIENKQVKVEQLLEICKLPKVSDEVLIKLALHSKATSELLSGIVETKPSCDVVDKLLDRGDLLNGGFGKAINIIKSLLHNTVEYRHLSKIAFLEGVSTEVLELLASHRATSAVLLYDITYLPLSSDVLKKFVQHSNAPCGIFFEIFKKDPLNDVLDVDHLKIICESHNVSDNVLIQLASHPKANDDLYLSIANKALDSELLKEKCMSSDVGKKILRAFVADKGADNETWISLLEKFYKSQCRSSVFNKADCIFRSGNENVALESIINVLYERSKDSPKGASAKTLEMMWGLRDTNLMKTYYTSKCSFSFWNQSGHVFDGSDLGSIKQKLSERAVANPGGASAETIAFFSIQ